MTCGVYRIGFSNTDKTYIGSSKDIERRFKQHKTMLKSGYHHSYKLQEYYNNNRDFIKLDILEECEEQSRTVAESEYINKYNSILNGFNVAEVGSFGCTEAILLNKSIHMPNYLMLCTRLLDEGLSHSDVIITSYMFNNYETCTQYGIKYFESVESIAKNTKSSNCTVKETIDKIIEKGITQLNNDGTMLNTNYYEFNINYFMEDFIRQSCEC